MHGHPVLIFREYEYFARVKPNSPADYETRTHWLLVPGQHESREATREMLESDAESARFAIYEPKGKPDENGVVPSYVFSEVVKVTPPAKPSLPTLRKV